jgi:hypothetical protein
MSEFEPIYRDHANLFRAFLAPISLPNIVPVRSCANYAFGIHCLQRRSKHLTRMRSWEDESLL